MSWLPNDEGVALWATLPPGDWELLAEARLGGARATWAVSFYAQADESRWVDLQIPPAAWLHEASADYVTHLTVKVRGRSEDAIGRVVLAPRAFLAWPEGPHLPPVVWTPLEQQQLAPMGVLDPLLREARLADLERPPTWLLPPVPHRPVVDREEG